MISDDYDISLKVDICVIFLNCCFFAGLIHSGLEILQRSVDFFSIFVERETKKRAFNP